MAQESGIASLRGVMTNETQQLPDKYLVKKSLRRRFVGGEQERNERAESLRGARALAVGLI